MLSALAAVTLACCIVIVLDERAGFDHYPLLSYLVLQHRTIFLSLSGLTLLLLLFVAHYGIAVSRNVWTLCLCFGGYFLTNTVLYTLRRYVGDVFTASRDLLAPMFYFGGLCGAGLFLSKAGETEKRPISEIWGGGDRDMEAALSMQLQSFNQVLVKVLKQ